MITVPDCIVKIGLDNALFLPNDMGDIQNCINIMYIFIDTLAAVNYHCGRWLRYNNGCFICVSRITWPEPSQNTRSAVVCITCFIIHVGPT